MRNEAAAPQPLAQALQHGAFWERDEALQFSWNTFFSLSLEENGVNV